MDTLKKHKNIIILSSLFLLEFALFRTCVQREIIGKCPRNFDQTTYLHITYHMYENIVQGNYRTVLADIRYELGVGAFPVFGLIYMFLFGKSRLSLLAVNFTFFALAQTVGFYCIKKISGNNRLGYIFIGLFLMVKSPFFYAGGLFDYRMDFSALCLYTCWISTFMAAHYLKNKRMYYLSAVFCGLTLMFRSNTLAYIGIAFLLFECIYVFLLKEQKLKNEMINLMKYGCVVMVSGGWYILLHIKELFGYYIIGHGTGEEPKLRMLEQNIKSIREYLYFYPKSLYEMHLGKALCHILLFLILVSLIFYLANKRKKSKILKIEKNEVTALFACVCGFVAPFIVLTIDVAKSPVVIGIVTGTAVIFVMLIMSINYNKNLWKNHLIYTVGAVGILLVGAVNYVSNTTKVQPGYDENAQTESLAINKCMEEYLINNNLQTAHLMIDKVCDTVASDMLIVLTFEDYDRYIDVGNSWGKLQITSEYTDEEVNDALSRTDLLVLTKDAYPANSIYPLDASFDKYREIMLQYAYDNLYKLGDFTLGGDELLIFGKAQAEIIPTWEDWMGAEQNWLIFNKMDFKQKFITLEGNLGGILDSPDKIQPVIEYEGIEIPCCVEVENERYKITVDITGLDAGSYTLEIQFENCFIPKELGINEDTRGLVIMAPDNIEAL